MPFPSPEQQQVIDHRGAPLVVLAGPGSGKTRTLVERMLRILGEDPQRSVSFITFTRSSRRDTDRRTKERLGAAAAAEDEESLPRVATLHTFAKSLVHRRPDLIGLREGFSVLIPPREEALLLGEAIADIGVTANRETVRQCVLAGRCVADDPSTFGLAAEDAARIQARCEELLRFYNSVDIPGLVLGAQAILEAGAVDLGQLFLHVDEYQDLNQVDQRLVDTIKTSTGADVVVVGDDDQSIYGGRFAHPQGIRDLMGREGWAKIIFRESHRLPPHILRAGQALLHLQHVRGLDKGIQLPADDGRRVEVAQCTAAAVEQRLVLREIKRLMGEAEPAGGPYRFSDVMVLSPYRLGLRDLAALLEREGIPVRTKENVGIPEELWQFLLLLRMVRGDDSLALRQWLPSLGLSAEEITALRRTAETGGRSLFDQIRAEPDGRLRDFLTRLERLRAEGGNFDRFLQELETTRVVPISASVVTAVAALRESGSGGRPSVMGLVRQLYEEYGLLDPDAEVAEEDKVLLTTLHSAKGLEARVVFIVHLDDRFIPNPARDWDEEIRVLYVGMTRAKQELRLSFTERYDRQRRRRLKLDAMSPFLRAISGHLNVVRYTASAV